MGLNLLDFAFWWLAIEIIGFVTIPLAAHVCPNLRDKGYCITKPLGLLLLTYLSWIFSYFAGYTYFSVIFPIGIIAACSMAYWRKGSLALEKYYVIRFELLFSLAFVIFGIIRAYSPEIYWTGGEKFMDMTFVDSLLRTDEFPPLDPWMSGTVMHYYYFGYLIVANLIRLTGLIPSVAFNLATASFFALSLAGAFGIGYNLTGKMRCGILTAFFVGVAGNLVGFFQLMDIIILKGDVINNILSFDYWISSRVIPYTINEFPFFSFLQGDVHAHMISITFQLLILVLLLNVIKSLNAASLLILALSIGFLYPLNTWDYPVYLFLGILVIMSRFFFPGTQRHSVQKILSTGILSSGALVLFSYLLYLPYHESYKIERTVSLVSGRTPLFFYLAIYGLFLYVLYVFVALKSKIYNLKPTYFAAILIPALMLALALKFELLIILIPMFIFSIVSILNEKDENNVFLLLLIITGIFISLFCELFYVQDALGKGNPAYIRLNTVFKLYIQNWILWAVPAGFAVFHFWESFSRKKAWGLSVAFLILMASVYPVFATVGKSEHFRGEPTLDGEAYVKKEHPQEYAAILWLRNLSGQPVVLQAPGELYEWNTYITAFTGLPTVIGWAGHELNWRLESGEIYARWDDAGTIYSSSNIDRVDALLKKYNVSYIYFGEAEAKKYSPRFFNDHPERFENVFEYGDVVVYRVNFI